MLNILKLPIIMINDLIGPFLSICASFINKIFLKILDKIIQFNNFDIEGILLVNL